MLAARTTFPSEAGADARRRPWIGGYDIGLHLASGAVLAGVSLHGIVRDGDRLILWLLRQEKSPARAAGLFALFPVSRWGAEPRMKAAPRSPRRASSWRQLSVRCRSPIGCPNQTSARRLSEMPPRRSRA